mgnify:CR=1 FL=1
MRTLFGLISIVALGCSDTSKGSDAGFDSKQITERVLCGWQLVEPHLGDYSLVVWMRPDVLVRMAVPFEAVAVGEGGEVERRRAAARARALLRLHRRSSGHTEEPFPHRF